MTVINRVIYKLLQMTIGIERWIKIKEYVQKLYRYPDMMIGRVFPKKFHPTDVLVFAAHPDDEILGLTATMMRHRKNNDNVTVVYMTDGSGRDKESWRKEKHISEQETKTRFEEGVRALSLIDITRDRLYCLGIPDGGTQRYLKEMAKDVHNLIHHVKPRIIYTHCMEGGHLDHDVTSLVVKSICKKMHYSNVYEWAEYSPAYPLGTEAMAFEFGESDPEKDKIDLSQTERKMKRKMLGIHASQDVEQFYLQGEAIRKAKMIKVDEEFFHHPAYQRKELKKLVNKFIQALDKTTFIQVEKENQVVGARIRHPS